MGDSDLNFGGIQQSKTRTRRQARQEDEWCSWVTKVDKVEGEHGMSTPRTKKRKSIQSRRRRAQEAEPDLSEFGTQVISTFDINGIAEKRRVNKTKRRDEIQIVVNV